MPLARQVLAPAAVAALLYAAPAAANGRFPATTNVETQPGDDDTIILPLTFGVLLSTDDGASFRWICEEAVGYGGEYDPDFEASAGGTVYAGVFDGLKITRDGGCTWQDAPAPMLGHWVADVAIGGDGRVWAVTASTSMSNDIFVSTDDGQGFAAAGLPSAAGWWRSVRVAPSDADRLYVSGYVVGGPDGPAAMLRRTDDGGDNWLELPATGIRFGSSKLMFFEGVSPTDPDVVYARSLGADPPTGDALYRSTDAGQTWTEILALEDTLTAFVARADGDTIIAATKSPCDGETLDAGTKGCVRVSTDRGDTWSLPAQQPVMGCITERGDGSLLACGANWEPDLFALGRSTDAQSWQPIVRFHQIAGPLSCPVGTVQRDTCEALKWPAIREQFGIGQSGDGGPSGPDASPGTNGGGGDCGCSAALAAALFVLPRRRRSKNP